MTKITVYLALAAIWLAIAAKAFLSNDVMYGLFVGFIAVLFGARGFYLRKQERKDA